MSLYDEPAPLLRAIYSSVVAGTQETTNRESRSQSVISCIREYSAISTVQMVSAVSVADMCWTRETNCPETSMRLDYFISDPLPLTAVVTWTLTTRLRDLLHEAETLDIEDSPSNIRRLARYLFAGGNADGA